MGIRLRDESGMGLLELLIAMVILNVGLFAIIGVFNGATVAIARAATISSATAVADKQMEIYRGLTNCAIWLDPASFPTMNSGSAYQADTRSYTDMYAASPGAIQFLDMSSPDPLLHWATSLTSNALVSTWATSCTPSKSPPTPALTPQTPLTLTTTPPLTASQAIQTVNGPDHALYWVYTYIILTQPYDPGPWVKQVTIVVRDYRNPAKILARETSLFNPMSG